MGCTIDGGIAALTLATGAENKCRVLIASFTTDGAGVRALTFAFALVASPRSDTDARFASSAADECAWLAILTIAAAAGFAVKAVNADGELAKALLGVGLERISGPRAGGALDVCSPRPGTNSDAIGENVALPAGGSFTEGLPFADCAGDGTNGRECGEKVGCAHATGFLIALLAEAAFDTPTAPD